MDGWIYFDCRLGQGIWGVVNDLFQLGATVFFLSKWERSDNMCPRSPIVVVFVSVSLPCISKKSTAATIISFLPQKKTP